MSILCSPIRYTAARWLVLVVLLLAIGNTTLYARATSLAQDANEVDFAAIDAYLAAQMVELHIPGLALGIVQGDQIIHLRGFGVADPSGRAVTAQTPFQIASLGKLLTGVAIMQLVEQGKLELDAPVQRYLPWFRVADDVASAQITVRHLLYHTSGLPGAPGQAGRDYALSGDNRPDALAERVRELRNVHLNRPVGTSYEYANAGYMILGLLIEQVSGQPYADYLRAHLFAPLQMQQAFSDVDEAKAHGLAAGYRYWFGVPRPGKMAIDRAMLPAGAHMSASAEDLTHFLIANLNRGRYGDQSILSPAGIAAMQRPVAPTPSQVGASDELHGMDWGISQIGGVPVVIKGGDNADFKTNMVLIPEQRLGVVVLINANNPLAAFFGDLRIPLLAYHVAEFLLGQPLTSSPTSQLPAILKGVLLLILFCQGIESVWSLIRLRRWRPGHAQLSGRRAWLRQVGLSLSLHLVWGLLMLVGVPRLLGMPLSFIQYMAPTLGYTLLVSGALAFGWSVVWVGSYMTITRPRPSLSVNAPSLL